MPAADFTPYYQPSGTGADGTKFDNALAYLQTLINALDASNWATGKIFAPSKLTQEAAATGQALVWNGTNWVPTTLGMTEICDQILGADTASFDTNTILGGNIPATYKHLKFVLYARGDTAAAAIGVLAQLNNDTGANYEYQVSTISGTTVSGGTTTGSTGGQVGSIAANTATASRFDTVEGLIGEYTGTTGHKSIVSVGTRHDGAGTLATVTCAAYWASTAAVTRLKLFPSAGNFKAGSRFTLYGFN